MAPRRFSLLALAGCFHSSPPSPPPAVAPVTRDPCDVSCVTGVITLDGKPVDDFGITFADDELQLVRYPKARRISARDGHFTLTNVPPGTFDIIIAGPTFARLRILDRTIAKGRNDLGTITVSRGHTIEGHVLDEHGQPARAHVHLTTERIPADDIYSRYARGNFSTATDAAGHFQIDHVSYVAGHTYNLFAEADARASAIQTIVGDRGDNVTLALREIGTIEGTVEGTGDLTRISIFIRGLFTPSFSHATNADASGAFRFDDVPVGTYRATVLGASASSQKITVTAGQTTTITFTFP